MRISSAETRVIATGMPVLLVDFNRISDYRLVYSAIIQSIVQKQPAKIVAFVGTELSSSRIATLRKRFEFFRQSFLRSSAEAYYASWGVSGFEFARFSPRLRQSSVDLLNQNGGMPNTLEGLERFAIGDIRVGDLIYDHWCKFSKEAIPNISSSAFRQFFVESVDIFNHFSQYFDQHDVSTVLGSGVYRQGIVLRIAVARGVRTVVADSRGADRLDMENRYEDNLFRVYPKIFARVPPTRRLEAIANSRASLGSFLSGKHISRATPYTGPSPYMSNSQHWNFPNPLKKPVVLIAPHYPFDSSHQKGDHFFPDFTTWLWEVGKLSKEIDAIWLLKAHPDPKLRRGHEIPNFLKSNPHIIQVPPETSPAELAKKGVKIALTVIGTIASEYPLLEISVINGSRSNPHIAYSFNIHPANRSGWESAVRNLETLTIGSKQKQEVFEYFFMRNALDNEPLFKRLPQEIHLPLFARFWTRGRRLAWLENRAPEEISAIREFLSQDAHWLRREFVAKLESSENDIRITKTPASKWIA